MIAQSNPYVDAAPPPPKTTTFEGYVKVDLAVIGAGYTGLSTAIHAARRGMKVVVLEAESIGFGGSGRNHGHCVPVYRFLVADRKTKALGEERLERRARMLADSGRLVFDLIKRYQIDCEAAQSGTLHVAHAPHLIESLRNQHAFYENLGKASDFLDAATVARLTGSEAYLAGWVHNEGGHLNPLAYARGLARGAIAEGVEVFTETPVTEVRSDPNGWRLTCPCGVVDAAGVAVATNAYTSRPFESLAASFFTADAFGIASDPLSPNVRQAILPYNHNVGDTRRETQFYRFDSANRLIVGGLVEPRRGTDFAFTADYMTERMRKTFPQIGPIRWRWHWSGRLAINLDMTPHLYRLGPRFFAMLGYSGRGVPTATALGDVLAAAAAGEAEETLPWVISKIDRVLGRSILARLVPRIRGPFNRWRDRRNV